jgi:mitogen-activated protein kinase kinase kinase
VEWQSQSDYDNDCTLKFNSGLTNRLILRVTGYYLSQIRLPTFGGVAKGRRRSPSRAKRTWAEGEYHDARVEREEAVSWLAKVLDSVRVRYRKIERYARHVFRPKLLVTHRY